MKKTLVMTIVLALLLSVVSVVSAATTLNVTVSASEVKDGETVVTINFDKAIGAAKFTLEYNKDLLTFEKAEGGNIVPSGAEGSKTITMIAVPSIDTMKVTFKVAGEIPAEGTTVKFVPAENGFGTVSEVMDVAVANDTAVVKLPVTVEPTPATPTPTPDDGKEDPTPTPATPTPDNGETTPTPDNGENKPTPDGDKKGETSTDEEKPGKYSQTGVNVLAIALPVVALVTLAGVVIAKKED